MLELNSRTEALFSKVYSPLVILLFLILSIIQLQHTDYLFASAGLFFALIIWAKTYSGIFRRFLSFIRFSLALNFIIVFGFVGILFFSGRRNLDLLNTIVVAIFLLFYLLEILSEERRERLYSEELIKLKRAVDNAYDHMVVTDENGHILYANKAAERLTGFTSEEMVGNTPRLWGRQMEGNFYKKFWRTIKFQKQFFVGEIKNKRKNGQMYFAEIRVSPVLDERNRVKYFVGIERDITKEKEADRMKAEFISLTSHQLKTPLTTMKLYLDLILLQKTGSLKPKQEEYLRKINNANEEMIDLIKDLLNITQIESGQITTTLKPTSLANVVGDVIVDLEPSIKDKRQHIALEIDPQLPSVNVDDKLIRNVYLNLIGNASKYTRQGGKIGINLSMRDGQVVSQIQDTGYGIPKTEQARVFQKFFRAENVRRAKSGGTGLGLYLAKLIVEMAGGQIWFKSTEGKGSTFWFTLPLISTKQKTPKSPS